MTPEKWQIAAERAARVLREGTLQNLIFFNRKIEDD
jgi:hypothetical protein